MTIYIKTVDNGLILRYPSPTFSNGECECVFQYDDGPNVFQDDLQIKLEKIKEVFYTILDQIEPNSKHNEYRLDITVEKN